MASTNNVTELIISGLSQDPEVQRACFVVFLPMYLATVVGNGLIVLMVRVSKSLRSPMYFFLSQLSLMDLMLVCTNVPKMAVNFLSGRKSISFVGCGIQMGLFVSLVGSEGLLLGLMAYDRYVAISHPLHYPILMSQRACLKIVESSWAFGIIDGSGFIISGRPTTGRIPARKWRTPSCERSSGRCFRSMAVKSI